MLGPNYSKKVAYGTFSGFGTTREEETYNLAIFNVLKLISLNMTRFHNYFQEL